jgi:MFS family permease
LRAEEGLNKSGMRAETSEREAHNGTAIAPGVSAHCTQSPNYKNYLLGVLTVILLFNYVDRVALGLLLQDIKTDLALSDTQLGFLSGMAFALFYSVMGIPIARWADRGNRVTIISLTIALWSIAVGLCGVAGSFLQLLLIRVAVAVGEAGCIPPAFSLIADYFTRAERPRAAAIYGLGGTFSALIGYFVAGWINELYGWRITFMLLAWPGLVLAILAWFTLKEPRTLNPRSSLQSATTAPAFGEPADQPPLREVCRTLWTNATFRSLLLGLAVLFFFEYGIGQWLPAFFVRSHGLSTGQVGTWLALTYVLAGLAGTYLGGELASRYAAHREHLQLKAMAVSIGSAGVLMIIAYLVSNLYVVFTLLGVAVMGLTTVNGPWFATIQTLVPERMRALSFALVYLFANLIGMGFGPLAAGALSDLLRPWSGEDSLRLVLLIMTPGYFVVVWYAWRASRTVAGDLAAVADKVRNESTDTVSASRNAEQLESHTQGLPDAAR